MAWQYNASTDQISGSGWSGTVFSILCWWYLDSDPNSSQDPWLVTASAGGAGGTRALLGTTSDGTTMQTWDSAFAAQAAGTPGTGSWYFTALVGNGTSWTTYHGSNPASLTTVGPATRNQVSSPGSFILSLAAEWLRGRTANLKIFTRALSSSDVAAEAAAYEVIDATSLVGAYSMLTSSLSPDYGTGVSFSAGATAVDVVAGPSALTRTGAVAGSTSPASGALTGGEVISGAVAGTAPKAAGALTGGAVLAGAVAGSAPKAAGALTGGTVAQVTVAGTSPPATGQLAGMLSALVTVAGTTSAARGALTAMETRTGALAAGPGAAFGRLRQSLPIDGVARVGTPALSAPARAGAPVLAGVARAGAPALAGVAHAGEPS